MNPANGEPPPLSGVLETVLYYRADSDEAVARFYEGVLGLRPIGRAPGRFQFYRAGSSVFLLFEAGQAVAQDRPPAHGPGGAVHTCFLTTADQYERWREHLVAHDVPMIDELEWREGGRSFYFHDPAGNVLEIANKDFWPK